MTFDGVIGAFVIHFCNYKLASKKNTWMAYTIEWKQRKCLHSTESPNALPIRRGLLLVWRQTTSLYGSNNQKRCLQILGANMDHMMPTWISGSPSQHFRIANLEVDSPNQHFTSILTLKVKRGMTNYRKKKIEDY